MEYIGDYYSTYRAGGQETIVEINDSASVLHRMTDLFANETFSDICLVVDGTRYPVHRLILYASSEVFKAKLQNPIWLQQNNNDLVLKEEPCCAEVFPQFLKYLYTGQSRIAIKAVLPLLMLANKYDVNDLKKVCEHFITKNISTAIKEGCLLTWTRYIHLFSFEQHIKDTCLKQLKLNFHSTAVNENFYDLPLEAWAILLKETLFMVDDEFALFLLVEKWYDAQKRRLDCDANVGARNLRELFEFIFANIRYPMMTIENLMQLQSKPIVIENIEFFAERIEQALSFHDGKNIEQIPTQQLMPRFYTSKDYCCHIVLPHYDRLQHTSPFIGRLLTKRNLAGRANGDDEYDSQIGWEIAFYARGTAGSSTSAAPHLRPNDLNHQMARLAIDAANNPSNSQVRVRLNGVDRRALQSAIRLSRRKVNKRPANDPVSKNRLVITCKSELPTRQQFYIAAALAQRKINTSEEVIVARSLRTHWFSTEAKRIVFVELFPENTLKKLLPRANQVSYNLLVSIVPMK